MWCNLFGFVGAGDLDSTAINCQVTLDEIFYCLLHWLHLIDVVFRGRQEIFHMLWKCFRK